MADSNTKFRVENGLDVVGTANVSGMLRVEGDLSIGGNLAVALNISGDIKPTANHTYNVGSGLLRWTINGSSADFSNTVLVSGDTTLNTVTTSNLTPIANNTALGSATRRWAITSNTVDTLTLTTVANSALANVTVSNTLTIGSTLSVNQTTLSIVSGNVSVNTGSKLAVLAQGNATYSNLTLTNDVASIVGNVQFATDLLFLDGTNRRAGLKNTTPSTAAVLTITGNTEFSTTNTGIRFNTSTASVNGSIVYTANATLAANSRLIFNTYDASNTTSDGGFKFTGTNVTATATVLEFNYNSFLYKSGNVVSSSNFGIYDVSGTRLGP